MWITPQNSPACFGQLWVSAQGQSQVSFMEAAAINHSMSKHLHMNEPQKWCTHRKSSFFFCVLKSQCFMSLCFNVSLLLLIAWLNLSIHHLPDKTRNPFTAYSSCFCILADAHHFLRLIDLWSWFGLKPDKSFKSRFSRYYCIKMLKMTRVITVYPRPIWSRLENALNGEYLKAVYQT